MSTVWLLILILIVLLVVGTSIFLYLVLRRARKVSFSADPSAKTEADKKEQPPAEFLHYATNLDLRSSFSRALRLLKKYVTGTDYRYRVPWFLMTGESESGKTTILDDSGINLSADGSDLTDQPINWFFFNEGVVIDVAGDFVLRTDGTADHRGWNTISRLLQKHRPRRPLDGIVLTIPCTDLVGSTNLSNERRFKLEQKAICLYKKLWQSQRILGMRLPVYVVITRCDEVTGFASFCNQLPDRLQTQMFGWSNPSTLEVAYKPDFIPEAFESFHKHLSHLQFEIYAERDEIQNADDLFLFPSAIQSMRAPLQVYLDGLFKQSAYHESFFFRGLYFCGEVSEELVAQPAGARGLEDNWAESFEPFEPEPPERIAAPDRKSIFVSDLFKEKIFAEDFLAQPIKRVALSRNRTVLAAQILSLLIILVGGVGLAASYYRLTRERDDLQDFLRHELTDLGAEDPLRPESKNRLAAVSYQPAGSRAPNESSDPYRRTNAAYQLPAFNPGADAASADRDRRVSYGAEANLLALMAKMDATKFYSVFIPSSWFSKIDERLEHSIAGAFQYVVFASLRVDLERRAQQILDVSATASPYTASNSRSRLSDSDSVGSATEALGPNFQLPLFMNKVDDLRVNLERYDRLVKKDSGNFDDLSHLVQALGHGSLPAGFDKENELYKRALRESQGQEIDTQPFFIEAAGIVADRIDYLYETSFKRGLKYDNLGEITETEALLRRPEYTWLATSVMDPRSFFPGMTISSALIDLRQALQDLKRQRFMSRDAPDELTGSQPEYQHRVRSVLVWDQESLHQAVALYAQYQTFVETKSYEPSEQLDDSVRRAARERVKVKIRRILRQAPRFQALPPVGEGSALKASLIEEIRQLHDAQDSLSRALQVAKQLGVDNDVRAVLSQQGFKLLREIQIEFASEEFYVIKQRGFSWWYGKQPVSYHVYDLGSKEDLAAYLNIQRKNIAFLGRDLFVPVQTFFASQGIYLPPRGDSQVDWPEMLNDLDAYDSKTPGNPIAALETFVRTDMDLVSIDTCSDAPRVSEDRSSSDYFLRIRNSLRVEFYARCKELSRIKSINDTLVELKNYDEIEKSFNANLAGGFPFSPVSDPQLDPWAMLKFFKDWESREKAARNALKRSVDLGAASIESAGEDAIRIRGSDFDVIMRCDVASEASESQDAICDQVRNLFHNAKLRPGVPLSFQREENALVRATEFLDQIDKVREFFGPFLEKKQGLSFDFRVQFRVQPDLPGQEETGGNQIIDWKLDVGKKKFAYLSDDLTGRWNYGDPIRLSLRWAGDSPTRPVPGAIPVPFLVKERTAVFEYSDSWSLFTLLLKHGLMAKRASASTGCVQGLEPNPFTLKFTIRTEPDPVTPPSQRQDLMVSPAQVFMRVSLMAANKQESLVVPCFPTTAPVGPSLFVDAKYYHPNKDE